MGKKPQASTMDKVKAAILGPSVRGSLYRWLRHNHDEFADLIEQTGRPNWAEITKALAGEKLLDAAGKSPTAERVRQTWDKVRKDVAARRAKKGGAQALANSVALNIKDVRPRPATTKEQSENKTALTIDAIKDRMKNSNPWDKT